MKQTNNALKFLLAQYRSIFKNAYVKGLATVALTAGLAVSAAQPAAAASLDATAWPTLSGDTTYTVDGTGNDTNTYDKIEISGSSVTNNNAFILNIESGGANNKIVNDTSASTVVSATNVRRYDTHVTNVTKFK